jgi:hypothetical protein
MLTYRLKAPVIKQPCRTRQAQALSTKERLLWATGPHTWCQGGARPAVHQRSEEVRAVREACPVTWT